MCGRIGGLVGDVFILYSIPLFRSDASNVSVCTKLVYMRLSAVEGQII